MALIDEILPRPSEPTRFKFTWAMLDAMHAAGILPDKTPMELRDGELILTPPEGDLHMDVKSRLIRALARALPETLQLGVDGPLRLAEREGPEPDAFVATGVSSPAKATGADVVLLIEVSQSSLDYDLGEKAQKYARHGVREYWVIDLVNRRTIVHRGPTASGRWAHVEAMPPERAVSPEAAPSWTFSLAETLQGLV